MKNVTDLKSRLGNLGADGNILNIIPTVCSFCGGALVITSALTGLTCNDKMCVGKRGNMLNAMLRDLELKGYGSAACLDIASKVNFATPVQLFVMKPSQWEKEGYKQVVSLLNDLQKYKKMTFARFLQLAALPNIGETLSKKIADGLDVAPSDFLMMVNVDYVQHILKIKQANSLTSINVTQELSYYRNCLLQALEGVELEVKTIDTNLRVITVCASDSVGEPFTKKQEFYDYIQEKLLGSVEVEIKSSVTKTLDYLLWDGGRETSKVKKAKAYIEKGAKIEVLDAENFCAKFEI